MRRSSIFERPEFTATPTPSPSPSLSPTPTNSPSPTPSPTPVGEYLWGAGDGYYGQLAQVNNIDSTDSMIVIAGDKNNWRQVSAGYGKAIYAKRSDNIWWCAGLNNFGNLGVSDIIDRSSLIQFSTDTTWASIQTQYNSSFGLKTDGTLWGWGENDTGNLAQNNAINYSSPVQITSLVTHFQVYNGGVARKSSGTIMAWGRNYIGKFGTTAVPVADIGIGTLSSPAQIFPGKSWKHVAMAQDHTLMVAQDGTLWGCGRNTGGELADNTAINRSSPVQSGINTTWTKVFCGYFSSYGLKSDGTLWSWGYNYEGQLGHYTNVGGYVSSPVQVIGNIVYDDIKTYWKWVSVRDVNGKMWVWGANSYGQLGMSNTDSISSPTQMPYPNQYWQAVGLGYGNVFGVVGSANVPTATPEPTFAPTASPTPQPTGSPTPIPTNSPTPLPTNSPTPIPTGSPTPQPTASPTTTPIPTNSPTPQPTGTNAPTATPLPTNMPNPSPTIDTTGSIITICYADAVSRTTGDLTAITFSGFNSAYGTLSIASYSSGTGTNCLSYTTNRPAYSDETAITISYDSNTCSITRVSTGQCVPTYTNLPVNNTSTKAPPTATPTRSPSPTPSPTPSATPAPATATPTPSPSASGGGGPTPTPTGDAACISTDVIGNFTVTAITYGYDYSNDFTGTKVSLLFNVLSNCAGNITVFCQNTVGNGAEAKIVSPDGLNDVIVADGTSACITYAVNVNDIVGVGRATANVTYGAGTITGYIVSGGGC
jgi:alpha-tubulin suppressor-like RCC1 family protein